jgi:DNA polymerase-3 subunit delta
MPVIIFEGPEEFLKQHAVNELRSSLALTMMDDPNIVTLDAEGLSFEDIMMVSSVAPFFAEARLTCVYGLLGKLYAKGKGTTASPGRRANSRNRGNWNPEQLWDYFRDDLPVTTTVLLVEDAPLPRKVLEETASFTQVHSFYPLSRSEVQLWIARRVLEKGGEIEVGAITNLADIYAPQPAGSRRDDRTSVGLRQLDQEIEKLCLYLAGSRPISSGDVSAFIETEPEVNIFRFVDAVYDGRLVPALNLLELLLADGKDPWYVYNMLAREARLLVGAHYMVKAGSPVSDIRSVLGLSPRAPLDALLNRARKISKESLYRNYDLLIDSDLLRKQSTVFTDRMVVQQLTEDLCVNAGAIA